MVGHWDGWDEEHLIFHLIFHLILAAPRQWEEMKWTMK